MPVPQVEQLVAGQVLQASPAIELDSPLSPLEKAAKEENSFLADAWHLGHETASVDSLKERRSSNLESQLEQKYSYIGISLLF
jgi:hypothetical protein